MPALQQPASSPQEPVKDDPFALAVQKAVNRAVLAEEKVKLYEEKLLVKDERLAGKDDTITELKKEVTFWQKAAEASASASADRKEAGNIDTARLTDAKEIIAKQQAEIDRLRHPGILASIFDARTAYGLGAGFAACKLTNGGTTNPLQQFSNSQTYQWVTKGNDQTPLFLRFDQEAQQRRVFLKQFQK